MTQRDHRSAARMPAFRSVPCDRRRALCRLTGFAAVSLIVPARAAYPQGTAGTVTFSPGVTSAEIARVGPGMRIRFTPGTYTNLAIVPKDGQWFEGVGGFEQVVLTSDAPQLTAFRGPAKSVRIEGLTIERYSPGGMPRTFSAQPTGVAEDARAQRGAIEADMPDRAPAWTIHRCRLREIYGTAIKAHAEMRVSECIVEHCGHAGITGAGWDMVFEDLIVRGNNRWNMNQTWDAAGIKLTGGTTPGGLEPPLPPRHNIVIRRCLIHANNCFGIWFDWNVFGVEVHHCSIFANAYPAISAEASALIHIHHCQIGDNVRVGRQSIITRGELNWQSTKKSLIEDNLIAAFPGGNGSDLICFSQHVRAEEGGVRSAQGSLDVGHFTCTDNVVRNNVFLQMPGAAAGFPEDYATDSAFHDDHGCRGVLPLLTCGADGVGGTGCRLVRPNGEVGAGALAEPRLNPATSNAFCFKPSARADHFNRGADNTYRSAGTPPTLGFDTGRRFGRSPEAFIPDWFRLPDWTEPPGR